MTPIVEMGFMTGNMTAAAGNAKNQQNGADEFQNIMNNLSVPGQKVDNTQNYQPKEAPARETSAQPKDDARNNVSDTRDVSRDSNSTVQGKGNVSGNTDKADQSAAVNDAEQKILGETAEKLDITVEELEDILAQLGLTAFDLLEPENISALVVNVMGDGDMSALVTDEVLSQTVLDLNASMKEIGAELAEELGVDAEDIQTVLEELTAEPQKDAPAAADRNADMTTAYAEKQPVQEGNPEAEPEKVQKAETEAETVTANGQPAEEFHNETGSQGETSADAQTRGSENAFDRLAEHRGKNQPLREDHAGIFQQTFSETSAVQDMAVEAARELMGTSPSQILDQINAYIRQNASSRITEWQMQLNPENLGTVGLNVTAKEGAVTAQFTTQNEAVKAVMEAQIITLKENLEQQGIKVEAVEVTVASHEFEQNLEQGDNSDQQMEDEQEKLRRATRKIDLGEFASPEDLAELDEAEQVTVEMMQADGNSMDYKV